MGHAVYCCDTRSARSETLGYTTKSVSEIFTQQKKHVIHESMDPKSIRLRECRDSEAHPQTVPVIIGLDVTGSMLRIPEQLVREGLPTMVSSVIQAGVPDVAILFTAVGDAECDRHPLQVGQFESGDAELDMWLTRSYLESGGGGNPGESYHLVWDFANRYVQTDAWDKRQQKGVIVTIGDEPVLPSVSGKLLKEVYGEGQYSKVDNETLINDLKNRWDIYHIHVDHGYRGAPAKCWSDLLGQNVVTEKDYTKIPQVIAELIVRSARNNETVQVGNQVPATGKKDKEEEIPEIIL